MGDSTKDGAEGAAAAIGAAALVLAGPVGAITAAAVALAPTVFNIAFNKVRERDERRANKLFTRLLTADEDPAKFADFLNQRLAEENEETITAFRVLLQASLDALSPAVVEVIAVVGREYLRGHFGAGVARAWMRLLSELDEQALAGLRDVVRAGVRRQQLQLEQDLGVSSVPLILDRGSMGSATRSGWLHVPGDPKMGTPEGHLAVGRVEFLFSLLVHYRLGRAPVLDTPRSKFDESKYQREMEGSLVRFHFHDDAFELIRIGLGIAPPSKDTSSA